MENRKYEQFILEKHLAQKLMHTNREERRTAYKILYGELFQKFPNIAFNPESDITHKIKWQMKFLKPFLNRNIVFVEVGAGNCLLSLEVANYVKQVIAYEVADAIPHIENKPNNLHLKIFDGIDFSEPNNSVDVIYINQVFEHIHPDDIFHHLTQYYNILNPEGKIVIVTPNSLTGPYDISRNYSLIPVGFHLKEYTYKELYKILTDIGFKKPRIFIGSKKVGYFPLNALWVIALEGIYNKVPLAIRYKLKNNSILKNLFGIKIVANK
jgi:SAM-dependent methyltransferase